MDLFDQMGGCRFLAMVIGVLLLLGVVAVVMIAGMAWAGWIG